MHISVTTPQGSLLDTEVDEVSAPGELGEFGILPGHIPFISALRPGVFVCRSKDGPRALAVGAGILQVAQTAAGERVIVLVEKAEHGREIDRDQVAREATELEREISAFKGDPGGELQALIARRAWAQARLDAAERGRA